MVVLILEAVPGSLRGELSRWMVEPHPGVFVGRISAMVRDRLWERASKGVKSGSAIMLHTTDNEQGYAIRTHGPTRRAVVDFDGLSLIRIA